MLTTSQEKAVKNLEAAFASCKKVGLRFFAMDEVVYVTNDFDPSRDFHSQYQTDEKFYATMSTHKTFISAGGW